MTVILVVVVTSASLIAGAAWGAYGKLPEWLEGFLVALAGGALIVAIIQEMVNPAVEVLPIPYALAGVALGAAVFTGLDWLVEKLTAGGTFGLLLAVTLDGIPENLALGTALIGSGGLEVAALAGSILLSNLPEAAGGTKRMVEGDLSKGAAVGVWTGTAALLSAAALLGYYALSGVADTSLAVIKCFAAGAVVASLAIEVFPQAFREDRKLSGIAAAVGLILAYWLSTLGG